jgi:hypothetical protein
MLSEDQYYKKLLETLEVIHQDASKMIKEEKNTRNIKLSEKIKSENFKKNDLVWLHMDQRSGFKKLYHPWKGPCKVLRKWSDNLYKVQVVDSGVIHEKVNIRRLKRVVDPQYVKSYFETKKNEDEDTDKSDNENNEIIEDYEDNENIDENSDSGELERENDMVEQDGNIINNNNNNNNDKNDNNIINNNNNDNNNERNPYHLNVKNDRILDWASLAVGKLFEKGSIKTKSRNFKLYCDDTLKSWSVSKDLVERLKKAESEEGQVDIFRKELEKKDFCENIIEQFK